jgi:hypothetical protein
LGERDGPLVDRDFVSDNFSTADEYREFVKDYIGCRQLPEDLRKYLNSLD